MNYRYLIDIWPFQAKEARELIYVYDRSSIDTSLAMLEHSETFIAPTIH